MKVLVVDLGSKFNRFGGQARIAAVLANSLGRYFKTYYLGYETAYSGHIKRQILLKREKGLGLSVRRSRTSEMWVLRFVYNLLVVSKMSDLDKEYLLQEVSKLKPDVIIANSIQDINLLRFFKKNGLEFRSIYIDHGSASTSISGYLSKEGVPLTIGTGINSLTLNGKKNRFFNFYDINVALNQDQLKSISNFTDKVALIPNGLDIKVKRNMDKETKLRKKLGIKAGDFVVLYMGRMFDRQKNIRSLITAFTGIDDRHVKLLLVGDGPSLPEYRSLARGDERVIFAGSADDATINYIYNISNLFILPSFWEGFSLTILEAAAHDLPIVLSNNAYIGDLKSKGIGRILSFDPRDVVQIRSCITSMYRNASIRKHALSVSEDIKETFTQERMIERYKDLILRLARDR